MHYIQQSLFQKELAQGIPDQQPNKFGVFKASATIQKGKRYNGFLKIGFAKNQQNVFFQFSFETGKDNAYYGSSASPMIGSSKKFSVFESIEQAFKKVQRSLEHFLKSKTSIKTKYRKMFNEYLEQMKNEFENAIA